MLPCVACYFFLSISIFCFILLYFNGRVNSQIKQFVWQKVISFLVVVVVQMFRCIFALNIFNVHFLPVFFSLFSFILHSLSERVLNWIYWNFCSTFGALIIRMCRRSFRSLDSNYDCVAEKFSISCMDRIRWLCERIWYAESEREKRGGNVHVIVTPLCMAVMNENSV